jgi:hypothetical protein
MGPTITPVAQIDNRHAALLEADRCPSMIAWRERKRGAAPKKKKEKRKKKSAALEEAGRAPSCSTVLRGGRTGIEVTREADPGETRSTPWRPEAPSANPVRRRPSMNGSRDHIGRQAPQVI